MKAKLATFGLILILLSFSYSIINNQININKLKKRVAEIEERKAQLERERDELLRILSDEDGQYMERAAREKGYVDPEERVFQD